jgi:hypothetical protein
MFRERSAAAAVYRGRSFTPRSELTPPNSFVTAGQV